MNSLFQFHTRLQRKTRITGDSRQPHRNRPDRNRLLTLRKFFLSYSGQYETAYLTASAKGKVAKLCKCSTWLRRRHDNFMKGKTKTISAGRQLTEWSLHSCGNQHRHKQKRLDSYKHPNHSKCTSTRWHWRFPHHYAQWSTTPIKSCGT